MKLCTTEEASARVDPRVAFVPATKEHCTFLAQGIRPSDMVELRCFAGDDMTPEEGLEHARSISRNPLVVLLDGVPCAMLGCETRPLYGEPWMVGTSIVDAHPKLVFKAARTVVARWLEKHGQLANGVWEDSPAVNWLKHLGFRVGPPRPVESISGRITRYRLFYLR